MAVLMMAPTARPLVAWVTPFITMIPFQSVKVVAYLTVAGIGCGKQIFATTCAMLSFHRESNSEPAAYKATALAY